MLGLYALLVALGLGLTAAQLLPTAELQREGIRGGGLAYGEAISFSLPPPLLLRSLLPGFWETIFGEYVGYVGTIPLCLAVIALAAARSRWVVLGGVLAALGLALAIGGYNPLYPFSIRSCPAWALFRVPARWLFVYSFGVALLAGLGAEWAWRGRAGARLAALPCSGRRVGGVALAAGAALAALLLTTPPLAARRYYLAWLALGLVTLGLTALALAGWRRLALGAARRRRGGGACRRQPDGQFPQCHPAGRLPLGPARARAAARGPGPPPPAQPGARRLRARGDRRPAASAILISRRQ